METKDPYRECATCKVLDDCPHPELTDDMMSSPLPPQDCPRPILTMRRTMRKHKLDKEQN
jgi:hypothetical protein